MVNGCVVASTEAIRDARDAKHAWIASLKHGSSLPRLKQTCNLPCSCLRVRSIGLRESSAGIRRCPAVRPPCIMLSQRCCRRLNVSAPACSGVKRDLERFKKSFSGLLRVQPVHEQQFEMPASHMGIAGLPQPRVSLKAAPRVRRPPALTLKVQYPACRNQSGNA